MLICRPYDVQLGHREPSESRPRTRPCSLSSVPPSVPIIRRDSSLFRCTGQLISFGLPREVRIHQKQSQLEFVVHFFFWQRSLGTGAYKLGANYGPCVMPQKRANHEGYTQNLWLHGPDHCLTEVGTMNMFVVFKRGESKSCYPLDDF